MKVLLVATSLVVLLPIPAYANTCSNPAYPIMMSTGRNCMPRGANDCGNGTYSIPGKHMSCAEAANRHNKKPPTQKPQKQAKTKPSTTAGRSGFAKPSGSGGGSSQPCRGGQSYNYRGECPDAMR